MKRQEKVVVIGGGPGGYEAALVAAHLGATTTILDQDGLGGAAVLPAPTRFKANAPSSYVRKRQAWIERQMRALGGTSYLAQLR